MRLKAPWGCDNPYCWDHVWMGVVIFGPAIFLMVKAYFEGHGQ